MNPRRLLYFGISILIGFALGLVYTWFINPAQLAESTPDTLRADYRADYALMSAEIFNQDGDVHAAARRLALLGGESPLRACQEAILKAGELGYTKEDLLTLGRLAAALEVLEKSPGGDQP
jgi:hypothetical protein